MSWFNIKQIFSKTGDRLFEDTPGKVVIEGSKISSRFVFQNGTAVPNTGAIFSVGEYKKMTIEVYGTATAFEVKFKGSVNGNTNPVPVSAVNLDTFEVANNSTKTGIFSIDVSGFFNCSVEVTSVSGGHVNVIGKGVI